MVFCFIGLCKLQAYGGGGLCDSLRELGGCKGVVRGLEMSNREA